MNKRVADGVRDGSGLSSQAGRPYSLAILTIYLVSGNMATLTKPTPYPALPV